MGKPFAQGELCLLVDAKGRRYLVTLEEGKAFHFHAGFVRFEAIVGSPEGSTVSSSEGARLVAFRPRLADYVLKMRRGAQVVYPKDLGPILVWADVAPGVTVLEAGTGSGALTLALVRAVGPEGRVVSVERRPDHAEHARERIQAFLGSIPSNLDLRVGEVEEMVEEVRPDRLILDLPEPWSVVGPAVSWLEDGGIFCAYLPTVPQVERLVSSLRESQRFAELTTFEVLLREWNVAGRSVRPEHRMVGHTGFLTVARKLAEG